MASTELIEFLLKRANELDHSPESAAVVAQMAGVNGPFTTAEVLRSEPGSQLFRAIAERNPAAAADCFRRVADQTSTTALLEPGDGRRNLVGGLEIICSDTSLFATGVELLLRLAAAESEAQTNMAGDLLAQLYRVQPASVRAPQTQRLPPIERGLATGETQIRRRCVEALGAALEFDLAPDSRPGTSGSAVPFQDWSTRTRREADEYRAKCFSMLVALVLERSAESELAQWVLGRRMGDVVQFMPLDLIERGFRQVAAALHGYWPEASSSLAQLSELEWDNLPPDKQEHLRQWAAWITPGPLGERLVAVVSLPAAEYGKDADGDSLDRSALKAEALADGLARRAAELVPYLAALQRGEQRQTYVFGRRLAAGVSDPREFIEACVGALTEIEEAHRSPRLLGGFLAGQADRSIVNLTLDWIARYPALASLAAPLTKLARPAQADLAKAIETVISGQVPPGALRHFLPGHGLDDLSTDDMIVLFGPLVRKCPPARPVALELLCAYAFRDEARWNECRILVREILVLPQLSVAFRRAALLRAWEQASRRLLTETRDEPLARELAQQVKAVWRTATAPADADGFRRDVMATIQAHYAAPVATARRPS